MSQDSVVLNVLRGLVLTVFMSVFIYYGWNMSVCRLWPTVPLLDPRSAFGLGLLVLTVRLCLSGTQVVNVNFSLGSSQSTRKSDD